MTQHRAMQLGMLICLAVGSTKPFAQDRADIDRTQIIGNRELPKVLYIVPWKKPLAGDLSGRPLVSVVDEALSPLDRDVFRREVRYEAQSREQAGKRESPTVATASAAGTPAPAPPTAAK